MSELRACLFICNRYIRDLSVGLLLLLTAVQILSFTHVSEASDESKERAVEVISKSASSEFIRSYSLASFQEMDLIDRQYHLPIILAQSLDGETNLTAQQQAGRRQVLSHYFYALPAGSQAPILKQAIFNSLISSIELDVAKKLIDLSAPGGNEDRFKSICALTRDIAAMGGEKNPTAETLLLLPDLYSSNLVKLLSEEKNLPNRKCKLSEGDRNPSSLTEIFGKFQNKYNPIAEALPPQRTPIEVITKPKNICSLTGIRAIFADAVEQIERFRPDLRVYIVDESMTCPVYGLVLKDPKKIYRFYSGSFRDDQILPFKFKDIDELMTVLRVADRTTAPRTEKQPTSTETKK